MTSDITDGHRRLFAWVSPVRVAVLATLVVALLLVLPISTFAPGDHEKMSCGNTLELNLRPWLGVPGSPDDPSGKAYWEQAYRSCNSQRIDRLVASVAVITFTGLTVTILTTRTRRRPAGQP